MDELLWVTLIIGAAALFWNSARKAAERASVLGRRACEVAGVQWLDQTVHADGLRLRRDTNGRLVWERSFRFEYSEDGQDRHAGRLVLHGNRLVGFTGPAAAASAITQSTPSLR